MGKVPWAERERPFTDFAQVGWEPTEWHLLCAQGQLWPLYSDGYSGGGVNDLCSKSVMCS